MIPAMLDDCSTAEILEELIQRLELTNGLQFCVPARVFHAIQLLTGTPPEAVPEFKEQPNFTPVEHDTDKVQVIRTFDGRYARVEYEKGVSNGVGKGERLRYGRQCKDDAKCMYNQLRSIAKSEGRW